MSTNPRFLCLIAAGIVVFSARASAQIGTLYDNGAPNLLNGFEITHWKEANPFTLTDSVVLAGIRFWDVEASASFQPQACWEIRTDNSGTPGPVLFSGSTMDLTHAATGRRAFTYPEYVNDFGVPSLSLSAGNYWLVLHNGPASNNISRDIFWETTTSLNLAATWSDAAPFAQNWQTNGLASQMAFQLKGVLESARPRITAINVGGHSARVTFTTKSGQHYRVEYTNSLIFPSWATVAGAEDVMGTGGEIQINDPDPNLGNIRQRFYRVALLP